jgi:hypothetical protein
MPDNPISKEKILTKEQAEEYTQSLGQIVAGSWRQIALAHDLGVPQALGMSLDEWVEKRLGGYIRQSIPERRQAVLQMQQDEGRSMQEIGAILGVDRSTVWRDVANATKPREPREPREQLISELAERIAVLREADEAAKQLDYFNKANRLRRFRHAIPDTVYDQLESLSDRATKLQKAEIDDCKNGRSNTASPEVTAAIIDLCDAVVEARDTHVPEKKRIDVEMDPWFSQFFTRGLPVEGP